MTDKNNGWGRPLQLEVIIGSIREGRFGPVVARWFTELASTRTDFRVGVLDLLEQPHDFADRVGSADAVVVVTPEYNHSYPGPLKTAIDSLGTEWRATAVGFVSYVGLSGGLRAVEPLRVAFSELHAVTVRETVSFHMYPDKFDDAGRPTDSIGPATAANALLDQLAWWGRALRSAKIIQPYGT
jgi:NAD(P)H-dependent FMN reductase